MARRRRGLGSTPAEHSKQATAWVNGTRDEAKATARLAAKGQCSAALDRLIAMNRQWGSAITAHQGAGWGRKFPNKVSQRVDAAEKIFAANCVAPSRARPSGPPRLQLVNGARRR